MRQFTYHFRVVDHANGGRLEDRGCAIDAGPVQPGLATMERLDRLGVCIEWDGAAADAQEHLDGHFVITPALDATASQIAPSPFREHNNYLCYWLETAPKAVVASGAAYTFPGRQIDATARGKFELTFVAESDRGFDTATQWSVDPEFDTGN